MSKPSKENVVAICSYLTVKPKCWGQHEAMIALSGLISWRFSFCIHPNNYGLRKNPNVSVKIVCWIQFSAFQADSDTFPKGFREYIYPDLLCRNTWLYVKFLNVHIHTWQLHLLSPCCFFQIKPNECSEINPTWEI